MSRTRLAAVAAGVVACAAAAADSAPEVKEITAFRDGHALVLREREGGWKAVQAKQERAPPVGASPACAGAV